MDSQQYNQQKKEKADHKVFRRVGNVGGRHCPHCQSEISPTCQLCPVCGKPTDLTHCSFCGAEFEADEPFCGECGSPRAGITCPTCGTLCFRSFCGKCNTPLNDNAAMAIAEAQKDPKFKRVCQLNAEMTEMENYLHELQTEIEQAMAEEMAGGGGDDDGPDAPGLSEEGQRLQAQYAELMKLLGKQPAVAPKPQAQVQEKPAVKKKRELKLKFADADKIMAAYKSKAAEMQDTLKSMLPDANMTPDQQRDFMCARKVPVITTAKEQRPLYWICNYCSCQHYCPDDCAEPWHGGVWITEEVTVEVRVWQYLNN